MSTERKPEVLLNFYTPGEEIANTLTHAAGVLIVAAGLIVLGVTAAHAGGLPFAAAMIYGCALLGMYLSSTAYHAVRNDKLKMFCRRMDHCSIYLLIAGTYTPLMLLAVGGGMGWTLLAITWVVAIAGITVKCFSMKSFYGLSLALYLTMGWQCMFIIRSLMAGMPREAFLLLVAGGLFYTFGVIFYLINRPYCHTIWHLFVLCGTSMHYLMVLNLC